MSAPLSLNVPTDALIPPRPSRLRLTRRGRLLLIGLPLMLAAAALLSLIGFFTAPAMAGVPGSVPGAGTVAVTVENGQTLWALAVAAAPERDPRDVVAEIVELNDLGSSVVHAGEQILVPAPR